MRKYSRLVSIQEKKHRRQAFIWIFLTIALIFGFIFAGLPLIAKLSNFIVGTEPSSSGSVRDTLAPPPPIFASHPTATNIAKLRVTGTAEPKSKVTLSHNGEPQEIEALENGQFIFDITLRDGENSFTTLAQDNNNNTSQTSKTLKITYDPVMPEITIQNPANQQTFSGQNEEILTIKGATNESARVTVNGNLATLLGNNEFTYQTKLNEGENTFLIEAQDEAGNITQKTITVKFLI